MPDSVVEFLRARLDEIERAALAASPWPWRWDEAEGVVLAVDDIEVATPFALSGGQLRATGAYIALRNPEQALREIEADRLMIHMWEQRAREGEHPDGQVFGYHSTGMLTAIKCRAAVHDKHPDYREEWRP